MKWIVAILMVFAALQAHATEYEVTGNNVNFRKCPPPKFSGTDNIIKTVDDGQKMTLVSSGPNYIQAVLEPTGEKGCIWKDFVQDSLTHEAPPNPNPPPPTDPGGTLSALTVPMCDCPTCHMSSKFDPNRMHPILHVRRPHWGTDIGAPTGTNVYAPADGIVKNVWKDSGYGNAIDITHNGQLKNKSGTVISSNGYSTRYGHLLRVYVKTGQVVKKGQLIAKVDTTGLATGPHLHFEIATRAGRIDPETVITVNDTRKNCTDAGLKGTATAK